MFRRVYLPSSPVVVAIVVPITSTRASASGCAEPCAVTLPVIVPCALRRPAALSSVSAAPAAARILQRPKFMTVLLQGGRAGGQHTARTATSSDGGRRR